MWTSGNRGRLDRSKLRYLSDLTDEEWAIISPLIPPPCVSVVVRRSTFPLIFRWAGWDKDVGYSPERKAAVLKRMLPPNTMAIRQLSQEEGILNRAGFTGG